MQRYAGNTIRSYKDYASIFLKHVSKYPSLEEIPLSDIEAFINEKVQNGKISVSYQKGLVGAIKKYNPQIEMFARFKMKSSFHKTKRII